MLTFVIFFFISFFFYREVDEKISVHNGLANINAVPSTNKNDEYINAILKNPKYLQCPAIFTVANLKKFILHKFGIDSHKFCVEIMYKVKTIALPDHYTLMDVAYIYTWKRVSFAFITVTATFHKYVWSFGVEFGTKCCVDFSMRIFN